MFDLPSKSSIEKISLDLLKHSKSIDVFPTPINKIIEYSELRLENGIDLSALNETFLGKLSNTLRASYVEAIGAFRGLLHRDERTILVDLRQRKERQNFVKLHEVGHDALIWQKKALDHLDDDEKLDPSTEEEFEAEANYFASITLFQQDRFERDVKKLDLGLKAPMAIAKKYGGSVHATIRRYVECSKKRCALLILEGISQKGTQAFCSKKDFIPSEKFHMTFGNINFPDKFGYTWDFTKDYYFRRIFHDKGQISLETENGWADFSYHFFYNKYNAFVFLFPSGEERNSKLKIVFSSGLAI